MAMKLLDEVNVGVDCLIVLVLGLGSNWDDQQDSLLSLSPPWQALRTAPASSSVEASKRGTSSPSLMSSSPGHPNSQHQGQLCGFAQGRFRAHASGDFENSLKIHAFLLHVHRGLSV